MLFHPNLTQLNDKLTQVLTALEKSSNALLGSGFSFPGLGPITIVISLTRCP